MARQLVSIQRILNIQDIEGADRIQIATILGWKAVIPKGEFQVGDLVCFFEIDSFLPIRQEYEFLRSNSYKKFVDGREGFRIRTRRFKKQISQGLILKVTQVGGLLDGATLEEGADITALLNVEKYEPPVPESLKGKIVGHFPDFMPKTDETRVQLLQKVLDRNVGLECYMTEKLDGTSATYYFNQEKFGICSRNYEVDPNDVRYECTSCKWNDATKFEICPRCSKTNVVTVQTAYIRIASELKIEERLRALGRNIALQGEIYGVGINGNPLARPTIEYRLFQIFDIDTCRYLDYRQFVELAQQLQMQTVPVLAENFILINNIDELVKIATRKSQLNPSKWLEGIVIRPLTETLDLGMSMTQGMPSSSRLSFKVVNPEYLLSDAGANS